MPAGHQAAENRLYLVSPPAFEPDVFVDSLAAALDAGEVACFLLALETADEDVWRCACEHLVPLVQSRDVAFLLNERSGLVCECGADGVHVERPAKALRKNLPTGAILGAGCVLSRHDAMLAGEAGADYVAFGPWDDAAREQLAWWQAVMELPCVALGGLTLDDVAAAAVGADFIALQEAVWNHAEGPAAAIRAAIAAVDNPAPH
ncbi:MAG: thiamine phosphate synthase [Alphaproteobacteria bacterium]|nr:thiamine phosphate synthase [Rhodospirillaceae bacterium]MBT6206312.1 thiamine phosphate synthase [Rhodospirillaceae bacterium]MBT6511986.1 thiamine phosphate synthase [Rhodospirillaceae bacterium]MBT7612566.1 thiamine phosphate synthase [Rhodospirillaceae bacterium]MDG2479515.1 thiamine phosphate synthase [Alphaproteobacteria bacterium]